MANELLLKSGTPRTSAPILVELSESTAGGAQLRVEKLDPPRETFFMEMKGFGKAKQAEFILSLPGKYRLTTASTNQVIEVQPQKDVPIFIELGLLSFLVLFFLTGAVLWAKMEKKKI